MKKWIFSMILVLVIVLSACTEEANKVDNADSEQVPADQSGETVTVLMNIQMEMIQTIRKHLEPVTSYESSAGTGDLEAAVEASNRIANELRGIEIPENLDDDLGVDMKDSIELLALYFEERAAALSEGSEGEAVKVALENFHQKIGETFEAEGLHAPNLEKDVQ